jgi:ketosteroid isomerase-like protein
MAEHPNAVLWREAQEAFSRRDMDAVGRFLADEVVYHFPGISVLGGDHKGVNGVLAFFAKLMELTEGTFRIAEVHDALANDEHVVALMRLAASRRGKQFAWDQANIYHVRDGKITECWLSPADQGDLDAFLS